MSVIANFFQNFGLFNGASRRLVIKETITDELQLSTSYLVLLVGCALVSTLGLLIDNSVVVMGSMLMAPLYWPIIGVALGISSGEKKLLKQALLLMILSTFLVLVFSTVTAFLSPLNQITREIQIRATPTLLDLLIALVTSVIGVLAIYDSKISSSIAGVALSLSLLPPLSNAGIGFAMKNKEIIFGSFQLYFANVIAIIFVGACIFSLLKFSPKNDEEKKRFGIGMGSSIIFLVFLATLFFINLQQRIQSMRLINTLSHQLELNIKQIHPEIFIEDTNVFLSGIGSSQVANIVSTIYLPENIIFSTADQNFLSAKLGTYTKAKIKLQLNIVHTLVNSFRENERQTQALSEQIRKIIELFLNNNFDSWSILSLKIEKESIDNKKNQLNIDVVVLLENDSVFDQEMSSSLEEQLKIIDETVVLKVKTVKFEEV